MLWERYELALPCEPVLVTQGIVALGDVCWRDLNGRERFMTFDVAVGRGRIGRTAAAEAAWGRVLAALRLQGTAAQTTADDSQDSPVDAKAAVWAPGVARKHAMRVDRAAADELLMHWKHDVAAQGTLTFGTGARAAGDARDGSLTDKYVTLIQRVFPDATPAPAVDHYTGANRPRSRTRLIFHLPGEEGFEDDHDADGERGVGPTEPHMTWSLDAEAYVTFNGRRVDDTLDLLLLREEQGEHVPPIVEMFVRSRDAVVGERKLEVRDIVPKISNRAVKKRKAAGIPEPAEAVAAITSGDTLRDVLHVCEKYDVQAAWALDGGRRFFPADKITGQPAGWRASRAGVRHCGRVFGERLHAEDSYLTEMVAALEALRAEDVKRVVLIFDASSPVEALRRFRRMHDRRRSGYYCDAELAEYDRVVDSFECIVFWWVPSHVGILPNEWVDGVATAAMEQEVVRAPVLPARPHRSVTFGSPRANLHVAREAIRVLVHERLQAATVESVWLTADDWQLPQGPHRHLQLTRAVAGLRCFSGDAKQALTATKEDKAGVGPCPFCDKTCRLDYLHFCFECDDLLDEQDGVFTACEKLRANIGTEFPHGQLDSIHAILRTRAAAKHGVGRWAGSYILMGGLRGGGSPASALISQLTRVRAHEHVEREVRRAICHIWDRPVKPKEGARELVEDVRQAWGSLLRRAKEGCVKARAERLQEEARLKELRLALTAWSSQRLAEGPARCMAVRALRMGVAAARRSLRVVGELTCEKDYDWAGHARRRRVRVENRIPTPRVRGCSSELSAPIASVQLAWRIHWFRRRMALRGGKGLCKAFQLAVQEECSRAFYGALDATGIDATTTNWCVHAGRLGLLVPRLGEAWLSGAARIVGRQVEMVALPGQCDASASVMDAGTGCGKCRVCLARAARSACVRLHGAFVPKPRARKVPARQKAASDAREVAVAEALRIAAQPDGADAQRVWEAAREAATARAIGRLAAWREVQRAKATVPERVLQARKRQDARDWRPHREKAQRTCDDWADGFSQITYGVRKAHEWHKARKEAVRACERKGINVSAIVHSRRRAASAAVAASEVAMLERVQTELQERRRAKRVREVESMFEREVREEERSIAERVRCGVARDRLQQECARPRCLWPTQEISAQRRARHQQREAKGAVTLSAALDGRRREVTAGTAERRELATAKARGSEWGTPGAVIGKGVSVAAAVRSALAIRSTLGRAPLSTPMAVRVDAASTGRRTGKRPFDESETLESLRRVAQRMADVAHMSEVLGPIGRDDSIHSSQ
jgi:hypothetical protein